MVFESYVVDLLNKFAGQYLENLDTSQLRLGIWGGDVQLENLILKESALDDLALPVKVLRGHLGKLVLKIPWKNLYSEPVVAQVDGLYLLVRPSADVKYNAEKEEKAKQERKQRQLEAVELTWQIEVEKKKENGLQKDEKSDSFVEKLAMQIVKNLQVFVRNIHIRYEDSVTNPSAPFSIGVTLENLSAESTDEHWKPSIVGKKVKIVHKLVKLDSLAIYWNTKDHIGNLPTQEDWVNQAKGGIAIRTKQHFSPPDFKYILQPISATTKVKMNIKPGSDLSIPKIFLSLVLEEISLVLMRQQYHDMIELLESFDRMTTNSVFRKYKPNVPLHGHAAQWWSYAITSILEEDVRRRLRNWSWTHMKEHRDLCREYKNLYKKKLLGDKASESLSKDLEALESKLDVLNITICRRQAAYEEAAALRKKKKKVEEKKSGSLFSRFWGKKKSKKEEDESEILTEDQKKEELEKLYSAIGYSEGETITVFTKEYVENKVEVILKQISVALRDDVAAKSVAVAKLSFQDLSAELSQRPSAQAIKLSAKVEQMKMFGSANAVDGKMPLMITSQNDKLASQLALFTASFETNPLDGKCDQRVTVKSQPVKVVYDANTVDHIVTFFKPPKDVHLQELSAEAYSRLEDLKSVSKASLYYAIEHHKITDVNVDVKSPFIIIPEEGTFKKSSNVLVIDLGHVKITSDPEQERVVSTKDLSVEELESKCYDKFDFKLEDLQILIAKADEDWQAAKKQVNSKMHILDPMGIDMKLQKALNPDDIRLAQITLSGTLPTVKVHASDEKLLQVIKLATSIPIPGGEIALDQTDKKPMDVPCENRRYTTARTGGDVTQLGVLEGATGEQDEEAEEMDEMFQTPSETLTGETNLEGAKSEEKEAMAKQVKVSLKFEIEEIVVDFSTVDSGGKLTPCLVLHAKGLGTDVVMHPWDISASASLSSLAVAEMIHGTGGGPLYLVQTPVGAELLSVKFVMVESDHPEYSSTFKSTKQSVAVEFSSLQVKLHQEALLNIIDVSTKILPPSEETPALPLVSADSTKTKAQDENKTSELVAPKGKTKKDSKDEIQIEVTAKLGGIDVTVTSVEGDLTHVFIGELSAGCAVRDSRTDVTASMKTLSVMDSTPGAVYPKIVSIVNEELFSLQVIALNDATAGTKFRDMEAVDLKFEMAIGCIRVIFLNKFVMKLLDFLNKFQRAKNAMEYARKTATESASATIQSLQIQSSRISMKVSIQAPLLIIPVSSTSRDAIVANLGQLSVSNTFNLAHNGKDPEGSDTVVIDNMVVELSFVKLLRAVMTDGETIGPTQLVLEPVNVTVHVARNLSPWYRDVPDIDVKGKLHVVKLRAGEDEIRTILGILLKNLSEGVTSRTDVTQLDVLRSGTGEEDDEAEEMDEMCQIPPETTTGESNLQRARREEKEAMAKQVKVSLNFEIEEIFVDFSTVDSGGKLTPFLALHVKGLGTDIVMQPWDISASASLSSLTIAEMIHGTGRGPLYLVQTPVGTELLSVKFVMVESDHPEYSSIFKSTKQSVTVEFSSLHVKLHQEALLNIIDVSTKILPPSEETPALPLVSANSTKTKAQDENKTSKLVGPKGKEKKDSKDEIQIEVTAKLEGIDVTVTSVEGDLTHVIIGELSAGCVVRDSRTDVTASMKTLSVMDSTPGAIYPNIVSIVNEELFSLQVIAHNDATAGIKLRDMEAVDLKFEMAIGCIRVIFLNKFVMRLLDFLNKFQRAKDAMEYARKTIQSLQIQSSRISMNVSIQAPEVIIPVSSTSRDAIVANLGQLSVSNTFNLAHNGKDPEGSDTVVIDNMVLELSSVKLLRAVMTDGETIGPTQLVLEPANVTVHVARNLSPWYRDVPDIDVKGKLHVVKLRAGEDEIRTILGILLKNLSEGVTSRTDVTQLGVLGSGTGEEDDEADEIEEMCQIPLETTTGESNLQRAKSKEKEAMAKQVKVSLKFEIEEIFVDFSTVDSGGKLTPFLALHVKGLGTDVVMHPWDISASASLSSLTIAEMIHGTGGGPLYLVQTPAGEELLSVKFVMVESDHPEYSSTFKSTKQSVTVEFSSLHVKLHQEALLNIIDVSTKILPPSEETPALLLVSAESTKTKGQYVNKTSELVAPKGKKKKDGKDEIQIEVTAKLGGIGVTVTSVEGDLTHAFIGELSAGCVVRDSRTDVTASMKTLSVLDSTPEVVYPKIVSIVDEELFSLQVIAHNDATAGIKFRDMEAVDLKFEMAIGCIRVIFLNKFVMKLLDFLNKFQRAKDAMEYARKTAAESASATIQSLQTQSSRISMKVSIQAPEVIIPVSSTSRDALVANLGHLSVSNTFNLAHDGKDPEGSDTVVIDNIVVELSSVKLSRAVMTDGETIGPTQLVLEPANVTVHVARNLSPWYHEVPDIDVKGKLHTVKLRAGEDEIRTILGILLKNLNEGVTSRTDVTQLGFLGSGTGEQAEEMDEMCQIPAETLTGESNHERAKSEEKEAMAKQVKVSLKFEIQEIFVDFSAVDNGGKLTPFLALHVKGLGTDVVMHPWDLSASASLSSLAIMEMIHGTGRGPLYLVQTPAGAELLSVKFVMVESDHPEYNSTFKSTKQSIALEFSSLQVKLHQEALLNIIDVSTKMLQPSEETPAPLPVSADSIKTKGQYINKTSELVTPKGKKKRDGKDEIQIEVTAKLGGIDVTVTSVEGDLTHVFIGDLSAGSVVRESRTDVTASMKTLSVTDSTPGAVYPKIVSIVNEEVFSLQVIAHNGETAGIKLRDMEAVDLKFEMAIGCIRVIFLNKFVMKLLDFLNKFQRAKDAMENARKTVAESASATIQSLQIQSSRISLKVSIQAPLVIIPVSSTSRDAIVANLGHLSVSNTFNLAHNGKDPEGSDAVVIDSMVVELSSIKLLRAVMTDGETIGPTQLVLEPANVTVHVARNLSPWYHDVPDIDVKGKLHAVKLRVGEDEIRTVLGILLKNLGEGITSRTDVTQLGVLGGATGERDDEAEEMDEMCQIPPETLTGESNLKGGKSEEKEAMAKQVKVSLKFEIEEVVVDFSTVDSGGKLTPCLALHVKGLGTDVVMHPWDLSASASLSSLAIVEKIHGTGGGPLYLVQTPVGAELLSVKFVMVESDHPEYSSTFKSTKQSVALEFSSLQVNLHQEALLNIIDVSTKMLPPSEETPALLLVSADSIKTKGRYVNKTAELVTPKGKKKKYSKDEIQIEVTTKLGGINVTVTSVEGDLTHVIVGDLSAGCVVRDNRTDVTASMKTLSILDSTTEVLYPKIVSIVNEEVFSLQVIAHNNATGGIKFRDMEAVDLKFEVAIGCIRVIFLNKFVMKLLDFLNKYQRAKDAMEYARKAAAESASAIIQSLQTQSSRISLKVSIQAPEVIIPVSSTSRDALVANLGHLSVSNTFNLAHDGKDPEGSDTVVIDNMVVELSSVKLSRAVMTDGETIGPTQLVLEPANVTVHVARNLSPWYRDVPYIDVKGKLHAVKLCAGEDEIRTIQGILFKNLSEGVTSRTEEISSITQGTVASAGVASRSLSVAESASSDGVWDFVKFSFEIEEVSAGVFWKEKEKLLQPASTTSSRDAECCLGQFSLVRVKASGSIKTNSAIKASVSLESCILDDKRPQSEEGVTRMIEKFSGGSSDVENMIDIQFQQTAAQDKNIQMEIKSFNAVVNLEFLLVLSKVFTSALATDESDSTLLLASKHVSQKVAITHPSVTVANTDEEPPQIVVQIAIKDPEIILLADGRDKNTNALFLKNTIDFRFVQGLGQQNMSGSVSDVVINLAAFDKERRASTKSRVLQLSHIYFVSSVPEGSSMHIDVSTAMAYIHVSPPTIRTLTACLMSLAPAKTEEDGKKATETAVDLWNEKPITTKDRWYLSPVPEDQLVPGRRVLARALTNMKLYDPGYIYVALENMIGVHFDGGFPTAYDPNDITAIVVDKDPDPKALVFGTPVVAKRSNDSSHVEGKVKERKEENGKETYLIDFLDGIGQWDTLDQIRILTTSKPGVCRGQIEVSSIVFVRLKDEMYRRGFVSSKTYRKHVIRLIGEVAIISVDVNDSAAVVPDVIPDAASLIVGRTVIATVDTAFWEAGFIVQIRTLDDSGGDIYRVRFLNGGDTWIFNINNIRILMTRKPNVPEGILDVGTVVWAHTSKIRYYKGFVAYKGTKLHVDLYDGDKFVYEMKDASRRVIPDVPPKAADIKPGTRVIAKFKNKPRYYSSTVMEVDASEPSEPMYHVKLDDGDETWDSLYHLRLLPKEVQVGSEEKPPNHVNANEAGNHETELLVFKMEGLDIKLEGLFGSQVIPLLSVDGSIEGEVRNWSSALSVYARVGVIGNYFNESVSEWEPLIEPVENENGTYRHWEVNFDLSLANGGDEKSSLDDNSEAAMTMAVRSKDELQLTVTKTCLDTFTKLGAAFKEAVTLKGTRVIAIEDVPPYQIWNELGIEVKLRPGKQLMIASGADQDGMVTMLPGQSLSLRFAKGIHKRTSRYERANSTSGGGGPSIGVEVQGYHEMKPVSIKQARVILQNVIPKKLLSGLIVSVVIQVETGDGQKIVTIRSPLQVNNHFPISVDLLCRKEDQLSRVTTIQPDSVFSVPLILAHKAALYLRPAGFGYGASTTPLLWNKLASEGYSSVQCPPPGGEGPPFHIAVDCEQVSYSAVHGSLEHAPNYVLHIYPTAVLHNYLPYNILYSTPGTPLVELKGGDKWPLFSVSLHRKVNLYIQIDNYQGSMWKGQVELLKGMDELTTFTLESTQVAGYGKHLRLGVLARFDGTMSITLYCPYWMVNKTGLYLEYKAPDNETVIPHPVSLTEPVMFSHRGKGVAFVRLAESDWSTKFSLDAAGSGGALKITRSGKLYEIGMQTTLSYFSLTKIVEFTPFNLINNHTEYTVSLSDSKGPDSKWTKVQPGECEPFWPNSFPSKNLAIRVGDNEEVSPSFDFEPDITLLLRINGKVGAVCADMRTKDNAAITTITPYFAGAATVRLENCTELDICYKQKDLSFRCKEHCLHPNQSVLFTWDEPSASREFVWFVKGSKERITTDLSQTGFDRFEYRGKKMYYSTFLDGLQRVLLITDDFTLAFRAQVELKERPSQCITLALQGVGLSLVNNEKSIEVAYIGIKPSDIIWEEQKKKGRWKALKLRLCNELEAGWNKLQRDIAIGATANYIYKSGDLEVDFKQMEIVRPTRQHIRRTFTPGISLEYTSSPNEHTLSTKINSVQIDSQVPGATFQTVLFPVPPPKSIAADSEPKPYIEVSLVAKQEEHTHVNEIKYFKVLIQEMDVKIDMSFIMACIGLFSFDAIDTGQESSQYALDKQMVHGKLGEAFAVQAALSTDRNFFDFFHLSPLKIHVSFSQLGGGAEVKKAIGGSFVSLLLKSVGVAVTEVQDVEFKLAYLEIKDKVYTLQQLMEVAIKHYRSQALKQLYVLVLGLDVLGNPFALLTGLKEGARDFFYEPYQGLIQGPGEFAEGLLIGATSLLGHTVGGAAGVVSRITGTLGKGIAALTMDDKYQQERRQAMGKKPVNVKEGLTRGGKGLLEGVLGGVTGIVTKPMQGAKAGGAAGFFKGLGKGVVGVVARPAGGLVDFASSTFEGIKGSAISGSEVKRLRPPRCFYADKVIKPYNLHEALGNAVLQETKKTRAVLVADTYFCHSRLNTRKTLLITNKHIIVAGKTDVFEVWQIDWMCRFDELMGEPRTEGERLVLNVRVKAKTKGMLKRQSDDTKIFTPSPEVAQWLVGKIKEARS